MNGEVIVKWLVQYSMIRNDRAMSKKNCKARTANANALQGQVRTYKWLKHFGFSELESTHTHTTKTRYL